MLSKLFIYLAKQLGVEELHLGKEAAEQCMKVSLLPDGENIFCFADWQLHSYLSRERGHDFIKSFIVEWEGKIIYAFEVTGQILPTFTESARSRKASELNLALPRKFTQWNFAQALSRKKKCHFKI